MEYLGSDCKPVNVSEKQVSDFTSTPLPEPVLREKDKPHNRTKFINLLTADFTIFAHKVQNKRVHAKEKDLPFDINTIPEILEVIQKTNGLCGYTGALFPDSNSITFERIDPNIGYTMANTIFCTTEANNCKSNLDSFEKNTAIPDEMKVKLLYKTIYRLNKRIKGK